MGIQAMDVRWRVFADSMLGVLKAAILPSGRTGTQEAQHPFAGEYTLNDTRIPNMIIEGTFPAERVSGFVGISGAGEIPGNASDTW